MGSRISHRAAAAALSLITVGATALILTAGSTAAQAAVWTDQPDYSPGSVVTFHGDNSDGVGYQAGETVHVAVDDPSGSAQSCDATADSSGAWSCQITLGSGVASVGQYDYTATGQASGVSQSGTFTDSACPSSVGSRPTDPNVSASFTTSGDTATYSIKTPNESPSGGIPGLVEYCVYPSSGSLPASESASYDSWTAGTESAKGLLDFARPGGDPTNLPFNGNTQQVGTATWSGTAPTSQTILLHINDPNECAALGLGNNTCFVFPGTGTSNQDLQVTKTATPSFTRTYTWNIGKSVDLAKQDIPAGSSATFNYTVSVTHDSGTDSGWQVTGTIAVANPNTADFTGVNVADSSDNGGTCVVANGTDATIPGGQSVDFGYKCTYTSAPTSVVTDTATATWDKAANNTPDNSATGTATADFSTATPTIVDGSIAVTDSLGGSLGTVSYTDPSPTTFTYSKSFSDPAGTCTTHDNTATFTTNTTGTTGSASQTVTVCVGADLTVTKTAAPSFTRTYTWGISKSVDNTEIHTSGAATFNYTVSVTHDAGTDSNWQVTGNITVKNPNDWESVPLTGVTDAIDNGGSCVVSGNTTQTIAAGGTATLGYTCSYTSAPSPASGTNTATATWDGTAASTPHGTADGTATADFGSVLPNIVDGSVSVSDTLGGSLGTVSYTDPSPTTFTYPYTFSGDTAGTCTDHPNTATFTTDNSGTTGSASQSVKVCVGADLKVSKNATPAFTRTYNWNIAKSVNPAVLDAGGTAHYTVTVTETGFTDSNWQVTGTITVQNPNDWEAVSLTGVTDAIDNGGSCTITSGSTTQPIAASGTTTLGYKCTYASAPSPASGTNTATATWDKAAASTPHGSASGTATADFGGVTPTTVNAKITVIDSYKGTLGTVTATDTQPFTTQTFTYDRKLAPPSSGCTKVNNIATIVETGQSSSASVNDCNTGALTMGFWQNKNGQGIITGGASTSGVCNSGTWLRQYAPFQDLSATATCSQVGTYVTNIIKAANASGAAMNAMLKAQMLATSLDVYFSDPALGGNKIGATLPIGGVTIDLTNICKMIDSSSGTGTCSGSYESASAAFGGATKLTISQMLSYAASQSNAGGSTWYGQVKATQGLAKDAFDAINNQVASSP
jgi:hypothetical protein